ncbi:hypothetical protein ADEAN_000502500 [Angomonas deanei]|uniref:Uncharacterized protein n=1 Tax=Angomonas deanei TaxID=59799 RepID=A0A7G2CEV2_9TRYP|nr:hypothetical protein ADEAN_000502500 [Angomonas deanei]
MLDWFSESEKSAKLDRRDPICPPGLRKEELNDVLGLCSAVEGRGAGGNSPLLRLKRDETVPIKLRRFASLLRGGRALGPAKDAFLLPH